MGCLPFCIWYLFWAVCDFFDLKPYSGFGKYLTKEQHKKFRRLQGILLLLLAGVMFGIFYVEGILRIDCSWGDILLWFGVPCLIPIVGLIVLRAKFDLPPFRDEE